MIRLSIEAETKLNWEGLDLICFSGLVCRAFYQERKSGKPSISCQVKILFLRETFLTSFHLKQVHLLGPQSPGNAVRTLQGPALGPWVNPCTSRELRARPPRSRKSASNLGLYSRRPWICGFNQPQAENRTLHPWLGTHGWGYKILFLIRGWLSPWVQNLEDMKGQLYLFKNQCMSDLHSSNPCCSRGNSFCVPGEADGEGLGRRFENRVSLCSHSACASHALACDGCPVFVCRAGIQFG